MILTDVQVAGMPDLVDVRCANGHVVEVGTSLRRRKGEATLAGAGGALLPGLHDHHIHLYALAALFDSVQCGPPAVSSGAQLAKALQADCGSGWLRGVGYHESVAGELDRWQLDQLIRDRPLKIQHRSGKMWMVNSLAAELLSLDDNTGHAGVELDSAGRANGRLFRLDAWMREQLAQGSPGPLRSLATVSRRLASFGITGVTDATPDNDDFTMDQFSRAVESGELLQGVRVMGAESLPPSRVEQVVRGERKLMLDENNLPDWDSLRTLFDTAHRHGRAVAVHCVTPAELVLALSVLREMGPFPGDRIEHASLIPPDLLPLLREAGVRVVTQPGFVHERGDQYWRDVATAEHDYLYRCQGLLAHDIPLAGSTDAPYGSPDPWAAMRAAVNRTSLSGRVFGQAERLSPEQALAMFTCASDDPGGSSRLVAVGAVADLCLLHRPWEVARQRLCSTDVSATIKCGKMIYHQQQQQVAGGGHHATVAA